MDSVCSHFWSILSQSEPPPSLQILHREGSVLKIEIAARGCHYKEYFCALPSRDSLLMLSFAKSQIFPQKHENGSCYCNESSSECSSVQYAAYITYSYVNQTLLLPMMSLWVSGTPVEAGVVLIFIGNKMYIFSWIHRNLSLPLPEAPILALLYILICVSKYVFNGTNQNVICRWHIWEKGEF